MAKYVYSTAKCRRKRREYWDSGLKEEKKTLGQSVKHFMWSGLNGSDRINVMHDGRQALFADPPYLTPASNVSPKNITGLPTAVL